MQTTCRDKKNHPAWVEIDIPQFQRNIQAIRSYVGERRICLTIKGNAYGHGLVSMAEAAVETGVDYLAVSCLQEGATLREAGIVHPILVLGAIQEDQISDLLHYDLEITLASPLKARLVGEASARLGKVALVHLEIDTGMNRTGMRPETAAELLDALEVSQYFKVKGVYSHLATAGEANNSFTETQVAIFQDFVEKEVRQKKRSYLCHLANSAGLNYVEKAYQDFEMVRVGILAFGYLPIPHQNGAILVRPCFSVKARVSYFKVVEPYVGISYGHQYVTRKRTRIVTIPIGYGDGYRRALSNKAKVLIHGKLYPVVGIVCMDQCMVDIGEDSVYVGDEVVLIGQQGTAEITLQSIADICDTITYEILCGFNERLPRFYLK